MLSVIPFACSKTIPFPIYTGTLDACKEFLAGILASNAELQSYVCPSEHVVYDIPCTDLRHDINDYLPCAIYHHNTYCKRTEVVSFVVCDVNDREGLKEIFELFFG